MGALLIVIVCLALGFQHISVSPTAYQESVRSFSAATTDLSSLHLPSQGYSPTFSILEAIEYLAFHTKWLPYWLVSVALLAWTAIAASLVVLEMTGRYGNKMGASPAIWAGLLVAAAPNDHYLLGSLASQQWLLADAFTMTTVFCLLRFRLVRSTTTYILMLVCAALTIATSETSAYSLPPSLLACWGAVIAAEGLSKINWRRELVLLAKVWLPCLLIAHCAVIPANDFASLWLPRKSQQMLLENFYKMAAPTGLNAIIISEAEMTIIILGGLRWAVTRAGFPMIVFMILWMDFTAAKLQDSMMGLAASSAPAPVICILIALLAIPSMDKLPRKVRLWLTWAGTACLLALFIGWASMIPR